jgi:competence protein ComEC
MEPAPATKFLNPVSIFIFSFVFGILVSSFAFVSPLISLFIFILGLAVLIAERIHSGKITQEVLWLVIMLMAFSLGAMRYAIKDFHEVITPSGTGIVVNEPEDKDNSRKFVYLSDNGEKVLVSVPLYTDVSYGDQIKVSGKLERPGIIESDGRDFDYGKYLAKDDIYHTLSFAKVEVLSSGQGSRVKEFLFKLKNNFSERARNLLAEPYASLLLGLIVAGRDALPAETLEEFRRAGVIHIVVLSGFNITLIAEFMRRLFQSAFLLLGIVRWAQAPSLASLVGVGLFVVMTGGEATVVRAALMALTVIIAGTFGRNYSASRALLAAGFLMLVENPKILVFDPSFQLSFLATLGLIYIEPMLKKSFGFITEKWQMRSILSQTVSTQLAVLPLLVYSVGDVSLVSLPANLLILITVPWTMLLGFLAVLISYLSAIFAWPLALVTHLLLSWILFVSHALGSLSFAGWWF